MNRVRSIIAYPKKAAVEPVAPAKVIAPKWTPQEDAVIKAYYGRADTYGIAAKLGRTHKAVQLRAQFLGVTSYRKMLSA